MYSTRPFPSVTEVWAWAVERKVKLINSCFLFGYGPQYNRTCVRPTKRRNRTATVERKLQGVKQDM